MNDFTKEELRLIAGSVFSKWINTFTDSSIAHLNKDCKILGDKLRSMIDNYCEHERILKHEPLKQCQCCLKVWRF